jgi:hypothetical protein
MQHFSLLEENTKNSNDSKDNGMTMASSLDREEGGREGVSRRVESEERLILAELRHTTEIRKISESLDLICLTRLIHESVTHASDK